MQQPELEGKWQSLPQRLASSTKLWAGSQLPTMPSWDPRWLTLPGGSQPEISPPEETRHTREGALAAHLGNWAARSGRWLRRMVHRGQCARQVPGRLSCLDLGRAQNALPTQSVPLQSTWEPEPEQLRPGKCTKHRACFGQHPCRTSWSLNSVDPESTCCCELGQASVVHTLRARPAHASDICLQCSSLPTAQLNKWA